MSQSLATLGAAHIQLLEELFLKLFLNMFRLLLSKIWLNLSLQPKIINNNCSLLGSTLRPCSHMPTVHLSK